LAARCPVVIKPDELMPLSALAVDKLAQRAGCPPAYSTSSPPMVIDQQRSAICLVRASHRAPPLVNGTDRARTHLAAQCAPKIKKLSLELDGSATFIVFDEAEVDRAVESAMPSKCPNAGQTSVCAN